MADRVRPPDSDAPSARDLDTARRLVVALEKANATLSDSRPLSQAERGEALVKPWKAIAGACATILALVWGAFTTYHELQAKPTVAQMKSAIKAVHDAGPVSETVDAIKSNAAAIQKLTVDAQRNAEVQAYTLEHMHWQGEVMQDIAQRKRPSQVTKKPDSLAAKERALLGPQK